MGYDRAMEPDPAGAIKRPAEPSAEEYITRIFAIALQYGIAELLTIVK